MSSARWGPEVVGVRSSAVRCDLARSLPSVMSTAVARSRPRNEQVEKLRDSFADKKKAAGFDFQKRNELATQERQQREVIDKKFEEQVLSLLSDNQQQALRKKTAELSSEGGLGGRGLGGGRERQQGGRRRRGNKNNN